MKTANAPTDLFEEEKELLLQLEKWDNIEESIYKQKSRIQWLQLGDTNSVYFFVSMKTRKAHNQIIELINSNGDALKDGKSIEAEVVVFYKHLLGTANGSIPAIHPSWIRNGAVLTRRQQLRLITPFIKEDVIDALKVIDDMKAPGGDEFNACFFKKSWNITGDEILNPHAKEQQKEHLRQQVSRETSSIKPYCLGYCAINGNRSIE
uniref:Uncharacterized protein LOC104220249 n=1 Tax=Nicotiana sylvestris TaxID=4096 RepID=A0A1U7W538_NICSY|nr:PREDICTED: uncharacterized protein LOC104220249 [Nicotiana sylvestris]